MSLNTAASNIKTAVAAELDKVQLPEGVEISSELKQQFADAGVRGTLTSLGELTSANLSYVTGSVDDGTDDVAYFTPGDLLTELFGEINS